MVVVVEERKKANGTTKSVFPKMTKLVIDVINMGVEYG